MQALQDHLATDEDRDGDDDDFGEAGSDGVRQI